MKKTTIRRGLLEKTCCIFKLKQKHPVGIATNFSERLFLIFLPIKIAKQTIRARAPFKVHQSVSEDHYVFTT